MSDPDEDKVEDVLTEYEADLAGLAAKLKRIGYKKMSILGSTKDEAERHIEQANWKQPGQVAAALQAWIKWSSAKQEKAAPPSPPTPPTLVDCELSRFLGDDLKDLAAHLTQARYRTIASLGDTAEAVRQNITKVVGEDYPSPGEIEEAIQKWKAAQKKDPTILDLPNLPEPDGGLDLTAPSIEVADVEYKIPDEFNTTAPTGKLKSAGQLKDAEWVVIAKRTGLLYAVQLGKAAATTNQGDDGTPVTAGLADEPALKWSVPKGKDPFKPLTYNGIVTISLAYTSEASSLVHASVDKAALGIKAPFVSLAVDMARNEKIASNAQTKTLMQSGGYQYIYAELDLENCTCFSKSFLDEITGALAKNDEQQRGKSLETIFEKYGHLVPTRVRLGGELYFTSSRVTKAEINTSQEDENVRAALSARYPDAPVEATASATHTTTDITNNETKEIVATATTTTKGGKPGAGPKDFAATTNDPNTWAVIDRRDLKALVDRPDFPSDMAQKVKAFYAKWLQQYWNGVDAPPGYVKPDMFGSTFSIRSAMGGGGLGIKAAIEAPDKAASLAASNYLGAPLVAGVVWKLVYSGVNSDVGNPIYYIVEALTEDQLTARSNNRDGAIKTLEATGLNVDEDPSVLPLKCAQLAALNAQVVCQEWKQLEGPVAVRTSPAAWTLEMVDPILHPDPHTGVRYVITSASQPTKAFGNILNATVPLVDRANAEPWFLHDPRDPR